MKSKGLLSLNVFVLLTVCGGTWGQGQDFTTLHRYHHYKLIDLGTLGGPNSYVNGAEAIRDISRRGTVAGAAATPATDPFCFVDCFVHHAFQWNHRSLTDLGALPGNGNSSYALWITAGGLVVGVSENGVVDPSTGTPEYHAVGWHNGRIRDLGTLGGTLSLASSANDHGQVVGGAFNSVGDPWSEGPSSFLTNFFFFPGSTQAHAFLWQMGNMEDLGTLGGPDSVAVVVNERGQVAGTSFTDWAANATTGIPTAHPFLWDQGTMRDLGTLGGTNSHTNNMNNRGDVVGWTTLAGDGSRHAFLWHDGFLSDLGTLGSGTNSEAWAVNDAGEAVGRSDFSDKSGDYHAFFWRDGVMTDLGAPENQACSTAYSINVLGQVVGDSGACGFGGVGWLWEKGDRIVALQTLLSPPSDIMVAGATFISNHGEIMAGGILPNGDQHVILLVPIDNDDADVMPVETMPEPKQMTPSRQMHHGSSKRRTQLVRRPIAETN